MTTRTRSRDDSHLAIDSDADSGGVSCAWFESVCTMPVTYRIVQGEAAYYCARHYVLTLAELVEVHLPGCPGSAHDHVSAYGPIGDSDAPG